LAKRVFSPSVWGSHIKPFLIESDNLKAGVKVASNKIKVMWGNPPKPYLWSVVPCMYDTKFADGCYKITSPILKVVIFLDVFSNDRGYVMRVRVEGVNDHHFLVLRTHKSIPDLVAYFAGADFWSKYLYPFIEENGYLKVGKLS